jgi:hypothetical protein
VRAAFREALVLVRAGGRRSLLAGAGVLLAATMLGTAVTVSWSLATGFDRSAKAADLPDVIARFDRERVGEIDAKLRALPNVAATSYRTEITRVRLSGGTGSTRRGVVQVVGPGRRGTRSSTAATPAGTTTSSSSAASRAPGTCPWATRCPSGASAPPASRGSP